MNKEVTSQNLRKVTMRHIDHTPLYIWRFVSLLNFLYSIFFTLSFPLVASLSFVPTAHQRIFSCLPLYYLRLCHSSVPNSFQSSVFPFLLFQSSRPIFSTTWLSSSCLDTLLSVHSVMKCCNASKSLFPPVSYTPGSLLFVIPSVRFTVLWVCHLHLVTFDALDHFISLPLPDLVVQTAVFLVLPLVKFIPDSLIYGFDFFLPSAVWGTLLWHLQFLPLPPCLHTVLSWSSFSALLCHPSWPSTAINASVNLSLWLP